MMAGVETMSEELKLIIFNWAVRIWNDILQVQEIKRMMSITRVPATPPFNQGVINLRGVCCL